MASKTLFRSIVGRLLPKTDTLNEEGRAAYAFSTEHALAQYAATGCLNSTFYAADAEQLDRVLELCRKVEPEFIARTALYARQKGFMKDLPALLCAVLSVRSPGLLAEVFDRVIDSPKMLRNFVQIVRSGIVGRKSLGTLPKRLVLQWLDARSDEQLFSASVGNDPSLADVIKMVHPRPSTASRQALFAYLVGRQYDFEALPEIVRAYEKFKPNTNPGKVPVPDVPFQMLTSLTLGKKEWTEIARHAPWQMTRMNLNTFVRHGVFETPGMDSLIADRLRDPRLVAQARVLPYQLMVAYAMATEVPSKVRDALQDAMEIAIQNVPRIEGRVHVCPDVSGSMHSPVTGVRQVRHDGGPLHRRCRAGGGGRAAEEPAGGGDSVRVGRGSRGPESAGLGNDQCPAAGVAAARRHELQCAVAVPQWPQGRRRAGDLRLGQRVVDRRAALRPFRRRCDGDHTAVERVQAAEPCGEDDLHRHPAAWAHPGAGASGYCQRGRFQRPGLQPDRRSGRRRRGAGPLGSHDCRHAIVTLDGGAAVASEAAAALGQKTRADAGRMPLGLHLPMSCLSNPLSASLLKQERKPGECRREYMFNRGSNSGRASGSSHQTLSPGFFENTKQTRDECRWNYMLRSTRLRVRVPSPRLAMRFRRGVAQWQSA